MNICPIKVRRVTGLLLIAVSLVGCSGSDQMKVSGQVTLDGNPVENGTISFLPADGIGPSAADLITDGRYTVEASPGPKRVEIHGYKTLGQKRYDPTDPKSPMVDIKEPIVPEKYNVKSQLTCDIERGRDDLNFALQSQ